MTRKLSTNYMVFKTHFNIAFQSLLTNIFLTVGIFFLILPSTLISFIRKSHKTSKGQLRYWFISDKTDFG